MLKVRNYTIETITKSRYIVKYILNRQIKIGLLTLPFEMIAFASDSSPSSQDKNWATYMTIVSKKTIANIIAVSEENGSMFFQA